MSPDRRPYVQFAFIVVAIGTFVIAAVQAGLVFWRLVDGWLGPF
jgi:hypothetical protein